MTAKPIVRFYAVIFNRVSVLLNEIHVDIHSKSKAHQLIKEWVQKHRPGVGFLFSIFAHAFCITSVSRAGLLLLPKERGA